MELIDVINARRSVRNYKPDNIDRDIIMQLINAAIQAPTGMNTQPWAFGVIQEADKLNDYSDCIKKFLLDSLDKLPWLAAYQEIFADPEYNVFYNAPCLIIIYAKSISPIAQIDCTLAAENLMLAACDKGLGSCWIEFANDFLNLPEIKDELGVPEDIKVIAPIIVGYPSGPVSAPEKNPADLLFWK
ncbi:MAG: nitroreductase family protein [Armatimonadota bacterium]